MSWFSTSLHVQSDSPQVILDVVSGMEDRWHTVFTTWTLPRWISIHAEDGSSFDAATVARAVSQATQGLAVAFSVFDTEGLHAEAWRNGACVAILTREPRKRPVIDAKGWLSLGLAPDLLKAMVEPTRAPLDVALMMARVLEIPERTVLADRGEDPRERPPPRVQRAAPRARLLPKLSKEVEAEWQALERDMAAAGISIPDLAYQQRMQSMFGTVVDDAALREGIAGYRENLAEREAEKGKRSVGEASVKGSKRRPSPLPRQKPWAPSRRPTKDRPPRKGSATGRRKPRRG